jgi:hypothetical protein
LYVARDEAGFDYGSLRQGDILEGVPFPLLDVGTLQLLGRIHTDEDYNSLPNIKAITHERRLDKEWLTAMVPIRFGFCVVLSNCCDLEFRANQAPAPVFTLARIREIPPKFKLNPENYESLRANKDPRDKENPGYVDYFYLEPHERLNRQDWRVHFNQITTLPTEAIPTIFLRKKILQLDDRARAKFKIKLGFTFGRMSDDELDAGLENPWNNNGQPTDPAQAGEEPQGAEAV